MPLDSAAWAGVAYDGGGGLGRVFVVSTNATQQGLITAFDAATGTKLWQTMEPGEQGFNSAPLPVNGTLYVTPGFGQQAINEVTGAIEWTVGSAWPGGAATATGMYTTRYDGYVVDVDPATGATIWQTDLCCYYNPSGLPVVSGGRLYSLTASRDQTSWPTVYDAANGHILGHFIADMPPVIDGTIGIFVYGSVVRAQNLRTGAPLWSFTGDCDIYTLPVAANGTVYIGSAQGNLYALNERTGALVWSDNAGGRIVGEGQNPYYPSPAGTQPALAVGEGLLAVPTETTLTVYGSAPGNGWTPAPISAPGPSLISQRYTAADVPDKPTAIVNGPDGNLWFIEPRRHKIARMTLAGAITEYDVPTQVPYMGTWLVGLTAGPDGALWFTEQNAYKIGRITTDGSVTEFATPVDRGDIQPSAPAGPYDIVAGPDGALWFTNLYGAEIDRMTTSGVTTVYQLPDALNDRPFRLTFGPDGNIWFTEAYNIGRMAPDGTGFVQFHLPKYQGMQEQPDSIVPGPDGNLWFTEGGGDDPVHAGVGAGGGIGRITLDGTITDFQTPTPASGPMGIVVGPDGNLWFTENNIYYWNSPNRIGRITPQGAFREYWIPGAPRTGGPWGITRGADGALWFSESGGNAIARLDINSPTCPAPPPTASTMPAQLPLPARSVAGATSQTGSGVNRVEPPPPLPQPTTPAATGSPRLTPHPAHSIGSTSATPLTSPLAASASLLQPGVQFIARAIAALLVLLTRD